MEDQESRFVCKWCNKKYPCGKSLGGHMRSHIMAISAESEIKDEPNMKKLLSLNGGEKSFDREPKVVELGGGGHAGSGYGLRENPKKTFKAVDANFPLPQEKVCKQCGKGFQSLKALCGHMACHSDKDRGGLKDDHSWTSENQKLVMDSHSDTEAEERQLRSRSKNKRYKRIIIKSSSFSLANGSSSVSEIDEQEQEEVAMCLMMLSRDSGNWGGVNSVVESSDNNSVVLETKSSSIDMRIGRMEGLKFVHSPEDDTPQTKPRSLKKSSGLDAELVFEQENSDSGYFLEEVVKLESDASVDGFHRKCGFFKSSKPKASVGARCEETLAEIKRGFSKIKSYKAELRKEMSRENEHDSGVISKMGKYEARNKSKDSSDNLELVNESHRKARHGSSDADQSKNAYKRSKYECLNCKKTFKSYQALGGHRPCHKRSNAYLESRYETGENSLDGDDTPNDIPSTKLRESSSNRNASAKNLYHNAEKKVKSKKTKGLECPFCHRIFKNGQALGGHKRSHFIGGGSAVVERSTQTPTFKTDGPELLDLNLPAPLEDENDGQFISW
ncbi:uncharacterized protein [Coffea arabica]|uniref:C2H2-type domain-containing protein n=1 Tax=Coffea arabica TaxID=13443 RepID=A0A6P6V0X0_COFAR|nr:uncharacterized protein LOC113716240 [Coffea arabica]